MHPQRQIITRQDYLVEVLEVQPAKERAIKELNDIVALKRGYLDTSAAILTKECRDVVAVEDAVPPSIKSCEACVWLELSDPCQALPLRLNGLLLLSNEEEHLTEL